MIKDRNLGFTLAEVLITLAIIGVVAALTIPTLLNNIQNQKYYSAFQKSYNTYSKIVEDLTLENGDMAGAMSSYGSLILSIKAKAKNLKTCPGSTMDGECMPSMIKSLDGSTVASRFVDYDRLVLADGTTVMIQQIATDCSFSLGAQVKDCCGSLWVDTNGMQSPNQKGRDIFRFYITKDKLLPAGAPGVSFNWTPSWTWYCDPSITDANAGEACSYRLLYQGKMDY